MASIRRRATNKPESFKYPRGAILNRDLSQVYPVNPKDSQEIKEYIAHSWYSYEGGDQGLHPWEGETKIKYTGPQPPFETLEGYEKYSFLKTPRWKDNPMEVGPLARLLVAYAAGNAEVKELVGADAGQARRSGGCTVLDAGTHGGTRSGCGACNGLAEGVLRRTDGSRKDQRNIDIQQREVGTEDVADRCRGRRPGGSAARRSRALDQDPGRQDRQLSARGADDVERFSARCQAAALFV